MLKTRERDISCQMRLNSIKSSEPRSSNVLKARSTDFCHPGIVGKKKGGRKDEGAGDDMAREMLRAAAHAVANKAKRARCATTATTAAPSHRAITRRLRAEVKPARALWVDTRETAGGGRNWRLTSSCVQAKDGVSAGRGLLGEKWNKNCMSGFVSVTIRQRVEIDTVPISSVLKSIQK